MDLMKRRKGIGLYDLSFYGVIKGNASKYRYKPAWFEARLRLACGLK